MFHLRTLQGGTCFVYLVNKILVQKKTIPINTNKYSKTTF